MKITLPALLYALKLIDKTKFISLSRDFKASERKRLIKNVKCFRYLVSFKLASVYCITNKLTETRKIKKVFKHYECLEDYKLFIALVKTYPTLMRKLKFRGLIPVSNASVQEGFYRLYQKYEVYIKKYVNKKLRILINRYRSAEDIERGFLTHILTAYYLYFLNENEEYVENCFKLCIRNAGKLFLEHATNSNRKEIDNALTKEAKIVECSISDELAAVLKNEEQDDKSELRDYILNGQTKGAIFCRCLLAMSDKKTLECFRLCGLSQDNIEVSLYLDWLHDNHISTADAKKYPIYYTRKFLNINDATFKKFKQDFIERFL